MILDLLALETLGDDRFRNAVEFDYGQTTYGGQLVAQALLAAYGTVDTELACHSLHLYFIRPGWPNKATEFQVKRLRDGRSYSHREVDLLQDDKLIARMTCSFQRPESGPEHQQRPLKTLPDPEQYPVEADLLKTAGCELSEGAKRWFELPIEIRLSEPLDYANPQPMEPTYPMWFKYHLDVAEITRPLRDALLAFLTDYGLLDASLRAHGVNWWKDQTILSASLDHSIWFHQDFDLSDWLFFDHVAPIATGGRCFNRGEVFSRDGRLLASITQEGVLRRQS